VKCETSKYRNKHINKDSISEFQIPGVGSVETLHHRNVEMRKTPFGASFRYWDLEVSNHFTTGMLKCEKHLLV
jgi:hypothetical protein